MAESGATRKNRAAWLPGKFQRLKVSQAPYTPPREHEVVVRNHAVAINPVDWFKQALGDFMFQWLKYPCVLGSDLAGVVVEIGPKVERFRVGDRVLGHAVGMDPQRNRAAEGAFQIFTVLMENLATPIPDDMPYEAATVLPLTLSTAACALFQKDYLGLPPPSVTTTPRNEAVLIWGGSTSVGGNAIQLAAAAGYEVVTTASPRNFDYVRGLGAAHVFDYRDPSAPRDIVALLSGKQFAGAVAIGDGSLSKCIDIAGRCVGRKFVAQISSPVSFDKLQERPGALHMLLRFLPAMLFENIRLAFKKRHRGVKSKFVFGSSLHGNEVSKLIYKDYLPMALMAKRHLVAPPPVIVGHGLEAIQDGLDLLRSGVTTQKVVVSL
ncbi:zinc-binding alcohol dehydrogenase family protein [Labrys monachus]|uniref:NADPH:quinone reductase-like Zn-dependent oxidoreductase n=1 Tax=Labrys monachus TaxID=217067 RepID=A0ABU0FGM2_9HYPH|nr:zinc-binding alcohol dehydrogenase family protein [Labrys monachus]MDQ0393759.1 NADPH:quinone reductase-like Zn-dependent oxidoreductase [Labrys monachus]